MKKHTNIKSLIFLPFLWIQWFLPVLSYSQSTVETHYEILEVSQKASADEIKAAYEKLTKELRSERREKDFYRILGVSQTAAPDEIRQAFNKLVREFHPDRHQNAGDEKIRETTRRMAEINTAFESLSNPIKKTQIDKTLKEIIERINKINTAYEILGNPEKRTSYDRDLNKYQSGKTEGVRMEDLLKPKGYHFYHFFGDFGIFRNSLDKRPFDLSPSHVIQAEKSSSLIRESIRLFQRIVNLFFLLPESHKLDPSRLKRSEVNKHVAKDLDRTFKAFLQNERIYGFDKESRWRVLVDFFQNYPNDKLDTKQKVANAFSVFKADIQSWYEVKGIKPYERKAIESFRRFSFLNEERVNLEEKRQRHLELLEKKETGQRMTQAEQRELHRFERQARRDIAVFRNILSHLGLPYAVYSDTMLRSYLDGLKETLIQNIDRNTLTDETNPRRQRANIYIKDADVIKVFKNIAAVFDDKHYQNLKMMSNPLNRHFLKSLPAQFLIFQAAQGASILRQALTDPWKYGTHRNPEAFIEMLSQSLSPEGLISLGIFFAVSQQLNYRLYAGGRFIHGKSFKTPNGNVFFNGKIPRLLASGLGMGAGFFAMMLFNDLIHDKNLRECSKKRERDNNTDNYYEILGISSDAIFPEDYEGIHYTGITQAEIESAYLKQQEKYNKRKEALQKIYEEKIQYNDFNREAEERELDEIDKNLGMIEKAYVTLTDLTKREKYDQFLKGKIHTFYGLKKHIGPCEAFRMTWSSQEKWKHYGIDVGMAIGSGFLMTWFFWKIHKAIQATFLGSKFLSHAKKLTQIRGAFLWGMGVQLYIFLELYPILDEYIGQPIKEMMAGGKIKNGIQSLIAYMGNDMSDLLPFCYGNLEASPNKLACNNKVLDIESKIKDIGHKFEHWVNIKTKKYNQSASAWGRQLSKLFSPYEDTAQTLQHIYTLSHFKYGLFLDSEQTRPWDSNETVNENSISDWQYLNDSEVSLSDKVRFNLHHLNHLKPQYCPNIPNDESLSEWNKFCRGSKVNPEIFLHEIIQIVDFYLSPLDNSSETNLGTFDITPYLGRKLNEMFSSHPDNSVEKLTVEKKLQLTKALINQALFNEELLSYFYAYEITMFKEDICSHYYPDKEGVEYYDCVNKSKEDICSDYYPNYTSDEEERTNYNRCVNQTTDTRDWLSYIITHKFLSTGIYLLKELLNDILYAPGPFQNKRYISPSQTLENISVLYLVRNVLPLLDVLEVYKKGERYFTLKGKALEALEEEDTEAVIQNDPYLFIKNLICTRDRRASFIDDLHHVFVTPFFFLENKISIYDFGTDQFQNIESICNQFTGSTGERFSISSQWSKDQRRQFHDILFNRPVRTERGGNYETLYLAIEDTLKNHSSIENSEELDEAFKNLSQDQLDRIGGKLSDSLSALTESYYKGLINPESEIDHRNPEAFARYYDKTRFVSDIRVFTSGGLKPLEVSIFQINYWMDMLEKLLIIGDQLQLNKKAFPNYWEGFKQEEFEKMRLEVLQLLQSYHDTYKKEQGPYLLFPDENFLNEINDIFFTGAGRAGLDECAGGNRFTILHTEYRGSAQPIFMLSDLVLSHILTYSVPFWNNKDKIQNLNNNPHISNKPWRRVLHSVLFELNKSLQYFYAQLNILKQQEFLEDKRPKKQTVSIASPYKRGKYDECLENWQTSRTQQGQAKLREGGWKILAEIFNTEGFSLEYIPEQQQVLLEETLRAEGFPLEYISENDRFPIAALLREYGFLPEQGL